MKTHKKIHSIFQKLLASQIQELNPNPLIESIIKFYYLDHIQLIDELIKELKKDKINDNLLLNRKKIFFRTKDAERDINVI